MVAGRYNAIMMNCNVEGLLNRSADKLKRGGDSPSAFALRELAKNLRELQRAIKSGDMETAKRFFEMYVFEEGKP